MKHVNLEIVIGAIVLIVLAIVWRFRRHSGNIEPGSFSERWLELQKLCSHREGWPTAIIGADKLLDEALKKAHFKGKTMGGRLVAAQRILTDNDRVWFAHKLRNQLENDEEVKLKKRDVQFALIGVRSALKDLKAL